MIAIQVAIACIEARTVLSLAQGDDASTVDALSAVAEVGRLLTTTVDLTWVMHKPGLQRTVIGATQGSAAPDAVAAVGLERTDDDAPRSKRLCRARHDPVLDLRGLGLTP